MKCDTRYSKTTHAFKRTIHNAWQIDPLYGNFDFYEVTGLENFQYQLIVVYLGRDNVYLSNRLDLRPGLGADLRKNNPSFRQGLERRRRKRTKTRGVYCPASAVNMVLVQQKRPHKRTGNAASVSNIN